MRFAVIAATPEGELASVTGVSTRRGVNLAPGELARRLSMSLLDAIYFVAVSRRTVVKDVLLPAPLKGRNLAAALRYELENLLPVPLEQVSWGWRRLSRDNRRYRLFAVHREETDRLLELLAKADYRCDCFIPAQALQDPDTAAEPIESALKQMLDYLPGDPSGRNLHPDPTLVPRDLQPLRHRKWRMAHHSLLIAGWLVALGLILIRWDHSQDEYRVYRDRLHYLQGQLAAARQTQGSLLRSQATYRKISETRLGAASVLPILADLNARLPDFMYLASYAQNGDTIEATVISSRDDADLARNLSESKLYRSDLRKSVQPDNQETIFTLDLRSLLP